MGCGRVDFLEYFMQHKAGFGKDIVELAVAGGNIDCLKYAVEHGCPVTPAAWAEAKSSEDHACLQFLESVNGREEELDDVLVALGGVELTSVAQTVRYQIPRFF